MSCASIDNELLERWGVAPAVAFPPTARALAACPRALNHRDAGLPFSPACCGCGPSREHEPSAAPSFENALTWCCLPLKLPGPDLCLERYLVERIEREPFHSDALLHIQHRLRIDGLNTSRHLRRSITLDRISRFL